MLTLANASRHHNQPDNLNEAVVTAGWLSQLAQRCASQSEGWALARFGAGPKFLPMTNEHQHGLEPPCSRPKMR